MKLFRTGELSACVCMVRFFRLNCHRCENGCIVHTYYNIRALVLDENQPLDEELVYYVEFSLEKNYNY